MVVVRIADDHNAPARLDEHALHIGKPVAGCFKKYHARLPELRVKRTVRQIPREMDVGRTRVRGSPPDHYASIPINRYAPRAHINRRFDRLASRSQLPK